MSAETRDDTQPWLLEPLDHEPDARLLLIIALSSPAAFVVAVPIDIVVRVNHAREFDSLRPTTQQFASKIEQAPLDELGDLPDDENALRRPAFAEASSPFQNDQSTYWADLNDPRARHLPGHVRPVRYRPYRLRHESC